MCGISVILEQGEGGVEGFGKLSGMHSAIAHRGPDGEGFLLIDAALNARAFRRVPSHNEVASSQPKFMAAVRRLRIHDLREEADQPFPSQDRLHWILLNGEIYNFAELRKSLKSHGHLFRTDSDTEVALAAYRHWGSACFEKFNGMWAIMIFDLAQGKLVGSRDRLGIKPLFYSSDAERLLFASEPKAIAMARKGGPQLEPIRFHEFLRGFPPQSTPLSFFKDVHPAPAGTVFEINLHNGISPPTFHKFWDLADYYSIESAAPSFDDAREKFNSLLSSSIQYQLSSDVAVGCFLSGGLDSSVVARLSSRHISSSNGFPLQTFSIIYDDPQMNEEPYIREVLNQGGMESHTLKMTPELVWTSVDKVVQAQGEPLLGQDLIVQYLAYRLAREHGATVVLEGQGADEVLAGLPYYESVMYGDRLARFQFRALFRDLQILSRKYDRTKLSLARSYLLNPLRRSLSLRLNRPKYPWLVPEPNGLNPSDSALTKKVDQGKDASALNRFLHVLVKHTNLPTVLLHQDRSSMAHGIESRVPFLDHRVVEYCFSLPASYKVGGGNRKRLLREASRTILPPTVVERKDKKAFVSTPRWMPLRSNFGDELRAMSRNRTMTELPWIRRQPLGQFVDDYLQGKHDDILSVWRLFTAWRWLETFNLKYSES